MKDAADTEHSAPAAAGPGAAARALRVLLSLPELQLRVRWLSDHLEHSPLTEAAELLEALADEAGRAEPEAREGMLGVALYFAGLEEPCPRREALHDHAARERLLSLERLLRRDPDAQDAPRSPRDLPVPDYGTGRELTVGERRSLARRPTRPQLEKLLGDPHPLVLTQLFACPKLTEADVVRVATRRPGHLEALTVLSQSVRWMSRRRVRLSLLLNPSCPTHIAVPLVHTLVRDELSLVLKNTTLSSVLRTVARELLERRPPLRPSALTLQTTTLQ